MEQQYSREDITAIKISYTEEIQRLTELKGNYRLEMERMKKQLREMSKQNADLRIENTELKAKIDIPVDGKEYNGKTEIQNIP